MTKLVGISGARPLGPGLLELTWDDGVTRTVDVSGWFVGHALLQMLNDPQVFQDVSIVPNGGGVEWSNGADFCAQALRKLSDEQNEPKARMIA
jgi:Protein of unknown function (DUF2442)